MRWKKQRLTVRNGKHQPTKMLRWWWYLGHSDAVHLFFCFFNLFFCWIDFVWIVLIWTWAKKNIWWMIEISKRWTFRWYLQVFILWVLRSIVWYSSFILKDLSAGFQPHRYAWNGESVTMLTTWTVCVHLLDVVCPNTSLQASYVLQRTAGVCCSILGQTWMSQTYGLQIHGFSKQNMQKTFGIYFLSHFET